MNKIEKLENLDKKTSLKELGINHTFYWAYRWTLETTNETINFSDVIWEKDVADIVKHCREFKIPYITVSSTFSGLLDVLAEFEKNDCKIGELVKITTSYKDCSTGDFEEKNAIKVIIK